MSELTGARSSKPLWEVERKVILETCYLTQDDKITACQLAVEAKMDYVKTSRGFAISGATKENGRLMKGAVGGRVKVKASGGIKDWTTSRLPLEAGAARIGSSASLAIMTE